jgi:hypothetical protein
MPMTMGRMGSSLWPGDFDDARLDQLEPVGDLRVVARDDELGHARQAIDGLEGGEHFGQARDDLDGLPRLDVVVEVRGVGGEHDRAAAGLDGHDLKARGVAADAVDPDAGPPSWSPSTIRILFP